MRVLALTPALLVPLAVAGAFWGADGHQMSARAAAAALPDGMPGFFADAGDQLSWLNPEPDRWRHEAFREMDQAFSYDHYVDLENVPEAARLAGDRFEYLRILYRDTPLDRPERDGGFLPFRILELYQRLVTGWARWYEASDAQERSFVEERILNDAGILGHYVTDAAQPHHTTIHFNGWNACGPCNEPNPEGFTEARDFHGRFESDFVRSRVRTDAVAAAVAAGPGPERLEGTESVREAVWAYIERSNARVPELYRLERDFGFSPRGEVAPETVYYTVARLSEGALMLRDLWWNAWLEGQALARARREGGV